MPAYRFPDTTPRNPANYIHGIDGQRDGTTLTFVVKCSPEIAQSDWAPRITDPAQGSLVRDPENDEFQTISPEQKEAGRKELQRLAFRVAVAEGHTQQSALRRIVEGLPDHIGENERKQIFSEFRIEQQGQPISVTR